MESSNGGLGYGSLEADMADSRNTIISLQIRFNGLLAHLLIVLEELVSQRKTVWQLRDECSTLRQQCDELCARPQQNMVPSTKIGIPEHSDEGSSPVATPAQLDMNAPVPGI
jgi:hypothetical protein